MGRGLRSPVMTETTLMGTDAQLIVGYNQDTAAMEGRQTVRTTALSFCLHK